jgi:hypothetical protein
LGCSFCGAAITRKWLGFVARLSRVGYPTPLFFPKSAELHKNKRVAFFEDAKKCKRAQNSAQDFEKKGDD